jgi:hypothetical protein
VKGRSTENPSVDIVQRLTFQMGVYESEKFSFPPVPIVCVRTQPPTQWVPGLFPGSKGPERGVDQPSHLAMLKKEYSYTTTRHLVLRDLF